jgi:hypothetical protein
MLCCGESLDPAGRSAHQLNDPAIVAMYLVDSTERVAIEGLDLGEEDLAEPHYIAPQRGIQLRTLSSTA